MESINRPELVREHNLQLVREALFEAREATRKQLSAMTGISNVTMGSLLMQLLENGEALKAETVRAASGRPAQMYFYNARQKLGLLFWVAWENGSIVFRTVLTDMYGEAVWEDRQPAAPMDHESTRRYFDRLLHMQGKVGAMAVGLPGVGLQDYIHKGRGWEFLALEGLREISCLENVPLFVENDVNLAALGYARQHRTGPEKTMAYFYLMKGAYGGSAVYLDGKLHLGMDRFAGELLPTPYGADWSRMQPEPPEALVEALLATVLPYLSILAPHQLVIASDYIRQEHLDALRHKIIDLLEEAHCPELLLTDSFQQDYREGLKSLVLEELQWKKRK